MAFVPGLQLAGPGAVEDLTAAAAGRQLHDHGATTAIAEFKHWFPIKRIFMSLLCLSTLRNTLVFKLDILKDICVYAYLCFCDMGGRQLGTSEIESPAPVCTNVSVLRLSVTSIEHTQTHIMIYNHTQRKKMIIIFASNELMGE